MARVRNIRRKVRRPRVSRMAKRQSLRARRYKKTAISRQVHMFRKAYMLGAGSAGVNVGTITAIAATNQNFVYTFNWSQLPEISTYSALFDEIMIKKIKFTFEPLWQPSNAIGSAPYQKFVRVCWDNDDATLLTTEEQYLNYSNVKSHNAGYVFHCSLYPKVRSNVAASAYKMVNPGFMDLQASSPDFYSVKVFVPDMGTTTGQPLFRVRADVVFALRKSI